jgi:hypothetical protein
MITQELYDKSVRKTIFQGSEVLAISPYIISVCCRANVIDCSGCYCSQGIMAGYECTKCGKHIYRLKDFIEKKPTIVQKINVKKKWRN